MGEILKWYLIISVVVAYCYMKSDSDFDEYMMDVPSGDWELYEKRETIWDYLIYIFFPALILVKLIYGLARLINF